MTLLSELTTFLGALAALVTATSGLICVLRRPPQPIDAGAAKNGGPIPPHVGQRPE
jgi:hypothetical protein